jgi:3',5'-cyclic-AMP phosphodiesterase
MSTAFPQPRPGDALAPGPMKVPADKLRDVLGVAEVSFVAQHHSLALIDASLSGAGPGTGAPAA